MLKAILKFVCQNSTSQMYWYNTDGSWDNIMALHLCVGHHMYRWAGQQRSWKPWWYYLLLIAISYLWHVINTCRSSYSRGKGQSTIILWGHGRYCIGSKVIMTQFQLRKESSACKLCCCIISVTVSLVRIKGTDCKAVEVGQVSNKTGGQVCVT